MPTKPLLARIAFATFLAIGGGILLNILYLQDGSVATAADRGKLDKAQQRALLERNRRLALDQSEVRDPGTIRLPEKVASAALMRPTLPVDAGAGPRATRVPASAALPVAKAGNATIVDAEPERSPDTVRLVHVEQRLAARAPKPPIEGKGTPGLDSAKLRRPRATSDSYRGPTRFRRAPPRQNATAFFARSLPARFQLPDLYLHGYHRDH